MNILLVILGVVAVVFVLGMAFRPMRATPPHFVDQDADGEPDVTEAERREALRRATEEG